MEATHWEVRGNIAVQVVTATGYVLAWQRAPEPPKDDA